MSTDETLPMMSKLASMGSKELLEAYSKSLRASSCSGACSCQSPSSDELGALGIGPEHLADLILSRMRGPSSRYAPESASGEHIEP